MGSALLRGLIKPAVNVDGGITVTDRCSEKIAELDAFEGDTGFDLSVRSSANVEAVASAAVVVVAVKPDVAPGVLSEITEALQPGTVVISVAAGITVTALELILPETVSVFRVMPNIPALVGRGVTGVNAGTRATDSDLSLVIRLLETVGDVLVVPEDQLDAVTSISGSGPAYVFYLIEQLTEVAVAKGFTPDQAALLVNGTFRGASELLASSSRSPYELRCSVTSPEGTTEAAVRVLQNGNIMKLFTEATDAAVRRARELGAAT